MQTRRLPHHHRGRVSSLRHGRWCPEHDTRYDVPGTVWYSPGHERELDQGARGVVAIQTDGPAPYAPPKAVMTVVEKYRDRGLTSPFDVTILQRAGVPESLAPRTLQGLKLLGLIDDAGNPTETLEALARTGTDEFPGRLAEVVRDVYAEVFQFVDPAQDSLQKIRDAFRVYSPRGQQERMVTLFLGLCEASGIVQQAPRRRAEPRRDAARAVEGRAARPDATKKGGATTKASAGGEAHVGIRKSDWVGQQQPTLQQQSGQHPFVRGLIQSLPEIGSEWPQEAREKWARAALAAFDLIYELPQHDTAGVTMSRR